MDCRDAQLLIAPHVLGDAGLTKRQRQGLEAHLSACPACAEEYGQSERVIRAIQSLPADLVDQALSGRFDIVAEGLEPAEATPVGEAADAVAEGRGAAGASGRGASPPKRKAAEGWAELKVLIDRDLAERRQARRSTVFGLFRRAGAIAACLALVVAGGTVIHHLAGTTNAPNEPTVARQATGTEGPSADDGRVVMGTVASLDAGGQMGEARPVVPGELVGAEVGQRLELRIWDRHEIALEPGARLAANRSQDGGCVVALSAGQITVAVNRAAGEGVFRLVTPHARLTVASTVFTVSTTFDQTRLSVTEGMVQFAAREAAGQSGPAIRMVSAGQAFTTDGQVLTRADPSGMETLLAAAEATKDPVAAVMQSRWYKQRFAPLLHLRDHLTARGVEVDELTLLAISAELWCIQYPKDPGADLPPYIHRKAGLERAAKFYGYQVQWLTLADASQAAALAKQALDQDDLVLTFGRGDKAVDTVDPDDVATLASSPTRQYRFLGEGKEAPYALARITRSIGSNESPDQLARQAVADMHRLLTATEDPAYWVGQEAVQAWADALADADSMPLNDPLLKALNAVAKLGILCHEEYAQLGVADHAAGWRSACAELGRCVESAFTASAFETMACGRTERRELPDGFVVAVDKITAEVSK